jgi:hypothetical protein
MKAGTITTEKYHPIRQIPAHMKGYRWRIVLALQNHKNSAVSRSKMTKNFVVSTPIFGLLGIRQRYPFIWPGIFYFTFTV